MNNFDKKKETVSVPKEVLTDMVKVYQKFEEFSDKLEDFIISNDEDISNKLTEAQEEHKRGEVEEFKLN